MISKLLLRNLFLAPNEVKVRIMIGSCRWRAAKRFGGLALRVLRFRVSGFKGLKGLEGLVLWGFGS